MGGKKVDAVDYLTEKIKNLDNRIEVSTILCPCVSRTLILTVYLWSIQIARQQIHEKKPENYGFASFESVPYAHIVAKTLHGKRRLGSHFELAPQVSFICDIIPAAFLRGWPRIVWLSPSISFGTTWRWATELGWRTSSSEVYCWSYFAVFTRFRWSLSLFWPTWLLCEFPFRAWVPTSRDTMLIIAFLNALRSAYVGFIDTWVNNYSWLFSAFVGSSSISFERTEELSSSALPFSLLEPGIVPPILTLVLQMVLPMIIR